MGSPGVVEFRVLGPVAALREGQPIRLGGERLRALLALLLLHANEPVSTDQLIEELFGGERSDASLGAVRVAISRLRRLLGNGEGEGDAVLVTRPRGYVLRAEVGQLDAALFERLLAEGRQLREAGDAPAAAARLREALSLWRGSPFADLTSLEFVQAEIRRLEELRLIALMERIDADLAAGDGAELVGELGALVADNPFQERLRGQLMLALYRGGRQADALELYRQTRELLRDELGLEPSRQLRKLERLILQHDRALDSPGAGRVAPPAELPTPATPFLGRVSELSEVSALLRSEGTRLLTLTGAGGSGKTRLALRVAESSVMNYPNGVWFVGFADITDPQLIAPTIGQALRINDHPESTPLDRLTTALADQELLLVLDNLEQLTAGSSVLGELLRGCPGLRLLVTSREPLHLAGERQYEVPVLTQADAVALFTARVQEIAPGRAVDQELAAAIAERVDRLPLAVELAAARTKALSPGEILARLDARLPVLTGGPRDAPRRQRTLRGTIDWSHELLSPDERQLFARLAVFAGGCTLAAAEAVCGAKLDAVQGLVDRSLVRTDGERYWMLQTIHEYALEKLRGNGEADDIRDAHARWFVHVLDVEGIAPPGWPEDASLTRLAREQENFRAALEWVSSIGDIESLARLTSTLSAVWVIRGQLHEASRWIAPVLEHEEMYEPRLAAQVVSAARRLARHQGDTATDLALASRSLQLWREVGDVAAIGRAMVDVGVAALRAGDLDAGRDLLQQADGFAREHGLDDVLAVGLNNLADLAILEGRLDDGIRLSEEGLRVADPVSAVADIALLNLAYVAMVKGDLEDALQIGRRALEGALRRGDLLWVAWAAIGLAWPTAEQGRLEQAARLLGAALEFLDAAGAGRDWMDNVCEEKVRQILREKVGEARANALIEEGRGLPLERAAHEALH